MELIQDVHRVPAYKRGYGGLQRHSSESLIMALYRRGVSIEDIFGIFYALEESANARDDDIFGSSEEGLHGGAIKLRKPLTVGDAQLAGGFDPKPGVRQPF